MLCSTEHMRSKKSSNDDWLLRVPSQKESLAKHCKADSFLKG